MKRRDFLESECKILIDKLEASSTTLKKYSKKQSNWIYKDYKKEHTKQLPFCVFSSMINLILALLKFQEEDPTQNVELSTQLRLRE